MRLVASVEPPIRVVNENKGVKRKTPNNPNNILAAALANQGLNNNKNNRPPPVRGPNAQSGVGSKNSMAGNRNKNLNNNASFSGNSQPNAKKARINQRGVKRARNNNNNVSQPAAKRVNTNRNKLIQNLKKNLSNAAINDYVKSYNNGTKSVNQIIQEVRANAKRKQNAKNAATLRTLRQLRPELFN